MEDRVAERSGHPLQDRGAREKAILRRRDVGEQLGLKVVPHEPVAAGERGRTFGVGVGAAGPDRQRGEVEAGGPALGLLRELGDALVRQVHSRRPQQLLRLRCIHAEVAWADLRHEAARPQRAERQRASASRRKCDLRAFGNVSRERRDRVEARGVREQVQIVEHKDHRTVHRSKRGSQARDENGLDGDAGRPERVEHGGVERRDAIERGRHIGEQHDRIVVLLVDVHPGERPARRRRPLRQQGRLPPTGAGGHVDDRGGVRSFEPLDDLGAGHAEATEPRRKQLGLEQLERDGRRARSRRAPRRAAFRPARRR